MKLTALLGWTLLASTATAQQTNIEVQLGKGQKPISTDLFGIFFEDLNYAADGGLYAELIQNRSFEYSHQDNKNWNPLTSWELQPSNAKGSLSVQTDQALNPNNPHYAVLTADTDQETGLLNKGFDGIPIKKGNKYNFSCFAKRLTGQPSLLIVRLINTQGTVLAQTTLAKPGKDWTQYTATLTATATDPEARFVLATTGAGSIALDEISLFPKKTFHNRRNGLRPDLAQTIADLHPKFIRFPGGCLVHGDGLNNIYHWKNTIGPTEQRKGQSNIWDYHQSVGLGYFEYFQFCEDIGAKPLPVVAAGVCCQNSEAKINGKWGQGQKGIPMDEIPAYIQEVLDLIEYANGPTTSTWGAKRAQAGHPKPFNLQYLGIGNEDAQTEVFRERFKLIHDAVKRKHPEITLIGTVGPDPSGQDYDLGWKFANEQHLEMVDEHGYKSPDWYFQNLQRFDTYDRSQSKVYLGEFAAHEDNRVNTLRSALAEAAYMTTLERNGDVVKLASYAPLLAKIGHTQWNPDMIYFTNTEVLRTVNYYVQQLFSRNQGDTYLQTSVSASTLNGVQSSCVKDSKTGELILKIVNANPTDQPTTITLTGAKQFQTTAKRTTLTGNPNGYNWIDRPQAIVPRTDTLQVGNTFTCTLQPNSLTVIRFKAN